MDLGSKLLISILFFLLILPLPAFAQGFELDPLKIIFGPDVPSDWYEPYKVLQYLVFPFFAIWMVIWGLLAELRIFRRKPSIQAFLALLIALIGTGSPTGALVAFSRWVFTAGAWWGILVFGFILLVGITMWGAVRFTEYTGWGKERFEEARKIFGLQAQISELQDRLRYLQTIPGTESTQLQLVQEIEKLRKELEKLRKKIGKREKKPPGKAGGASKSSVPFYVS